MLESRGAGASPSKPALCISLCIRDVEAGGQVDSRLWSRYTTTEFMAPVMVWGSRTWHKWASGTLQLRTQDRGCCFCHPRKWIHVLGDNIGRLLIGLDCDKMGGSHLGPLTSSVPCLVSDFKLTWTHVGCLSVACLSNSKPDSHQDRKQRLWRSVSDKPHLHACWRIEPAPDLRGAPTQRQSCLQFWLSTSLLITQPMSSLSTVHSSSSF